MKRLCVETFSVYTGANATPEYIYTHLFFSSFFPKPRATDMCDEQFCKPTDMPMYFSVFPGQKHAAYCEFYLSLCPYGNMTQYAVQLFCFLGVSTVRTIPPLSDGALTLATFSTAALETQHVGKNPDDAVVARRLNSRRRRRGAVGGRLMSLKSSDEAAVEERGSWRHDKHPVSYFCRIRLSPPRSFEHPLRAELKNQIFLY